MSDSIFQLYFMAEIFKGIFKIINVFLITSSVLKRNTKIINLLANFLIDKQCLSINHLNIHFWQSSEIIYANLVNNNKRLL